LHCLDAKSAKVLAAYRMKELNLNVYSTFLHKFNAGRATGLPILHTRRMLTDKGTQCGVPYRLDESGLARSRS
jgi:hypothetical protein